MNFWLTVLTGISDPKLCLVFGVHSLHAVMCVPTRWKSTDWIRVLEDKVLIFDLSSSRRFIDSLLLHSLQFFHLIETFLMSFTKILILF